MVSGNPASAPAKESLQQTEHAKNFLPPSKHGSQYGIIKNQAFLPGAAKTIHTRMWNPQGENVENVGGGDGVEKRLNSRGDVHSVSNSQNRFPFLENLGFPQPPHPLLLRRRTIIIKHALKIRRSTMRIHINTQELNAGISTVIKAPSVRPTGSRLGGGYL